MSLVVEELSRFDDLRGEWDELLSRSASPTNVFSSWDWQRLWWDTLGGDAQLRLITIRDEERLAGIWPLMQRGPTATLVGGVEVCDYLDVIAMRGKEEAVLASGMTSLASAGVEHLDLRFVPADSPTLRYLPTLADRAGWRAAQSVDDVCPAVALPDSWEAYLASLTKKDRHELRRKLRRLAEAGAVQWQVDSGADDLEQDTADFLRLHRCSGPEKASFMTPAMECFFRAILRRFRPTGRLKLFFLALDGCRVASTLCIDQPDELWVYNSGFDRAFAYCSVGLAIKAYCIEHAITAGKRKVDYLRGREPYKYDLGARDVPVWRLQLLRN